MRQTTYTYYCDVCDVVIAEKNLNSEATLELKLNHTSQLVRTYIHLCDVCYSGIYKGVDSLLENYKQIDRRGSVV